MFRDADYAVFTEYYLDVAEAAFVMGNRGSRELRTPVMALFLAQ